MYFDEQRLKAVLAQDLVPVIIRLGLTGEGLRLRLPYAAGNRQWLQQSKRTSPRWRSDKKYWEVPKAWFDELVTKTLDRFGKVYVIQPFREQEKCSPACLNANGHECQCSCMGAHHGAGNNGSWFEVSETFATRWSEQYLACRLMTRK